MRTGTQVCEPGPAELAIAAHPLGRSLGADAEGGCSRLLRATPLDNHFGNLLSTINGQLGILVIVHSISSWKTGLLVTTSFSRSDRMDNLLKLHTYSLFLNSHQFALNQTRDPGLAGSGQHIDLAAHAELRQVDARLDREAGVG